MQAGTIRRWRKAPGQPVARGDVIVEIDTEGGLLEVQSPVDGFLEQILAARGTTLSVNSPLAVVGDNRGQSTAPPAAVATPTQIGSARETSSKAQQKESPMSSTSQSLPVVPILMPKAGQTMEEGTLLKWHVKPGDRIEKGQVIFEIETDKANMDVEAVVSGRLARIVLAEGQSCKVLEPVAYLAEKDEDVDAFLAAGGAAATPQGPSAEPAPAAHSAPESSVTAAAAPEATRVKASPAARRLATERGVSLAAIAPGSGPHGRVLSTDVLNAAVAAPAAPSPTPAAQPAPAPEGVARRKMSQMRKAIARNLTLSKQTIPHFYIKATINAEPLMAFYQQEKAKYQCTLNDVIIAACARCITEFAPFRSRIEGDEIIEVPSANIGIAVGLEDGLVVPVLTAAEKLTLQQIGVESKRLAAAARAGKLEGVGKGVFTITNMGMFGVEEFSAIINPPESAILAVGTIREEVIVSGGTLRPGRVMTLTLSTDHRLIDGVMAARFLNRLKELLEWPAQLLA